MARSDDGTRERDAEAARIQQLLEDEDELLTERAAEDTPAEELDEALDAVERQLRSPSRNETNTG